MSILAVASYVLSSCNGITAKLPNGGSVIRTSILSKQKYSGMVYAMKPDGTIILSDEKVDNDEVSGVTGLATRWLIRGISRDLTGAATSMFGKSVESKTAIAKSADAVKTEEIKAGVEKTAILNPTAE